MAQTRQADEIWVVDDASAHETCVNGARRMSHDVAGAAAHRLDVNAGKRHAQGYAFERTRSQIVVTMEAGRATGKLVVLP